MVHLLSTTMIGVLSLGSLTLKKNERSRGTYSWREVRIGCRMTFSIYLLRDGDEEIMTLSFQLFLESTFLLLSFMWYCFLILFPLFLFTPGVHQKSY